MEDRCWYCDSMNIYVSYDYYNKRNVVHCGDCGEEYETNDHKSCR